MEEFTKQIRDAAQKMATARRDQARATAQKRKEEYLGARVPGELKRRVIAKADEMGIPVSILIRNVLEEAFGEGIKRQQPATADVQSSTATPITDDYPGVIGWESIMLNRAMDCSSCGSAVEKGNKVTLGLAAPGEEHVILCSSCKRAD